ncbi:MAG: tRNA lysidine(34) synthetase TilS [Hydrogenothermus sp.]|nr:MAG: tRNA lysidine(34) synthetase TilS [Hydrogenothermus sp.]
MNLEKKFLKAISDFNLISPDDNLLIAFSTGVDSSVLLHLILKFKNYLNIREVAVAYFNHSIRKQSDEEELFVKELSKKLEIKAFTKKEDLFSYAKKNKLSLEEAGRNLRYKFFTEILHKEGFNKVATAHHLSDLAETMVLWFLQGSKNGLKGFKPKEGNIIRPMIYITKDEIYEYAYENKIRFFEDITNEDETILRNKVRKSIIPLLKEINPSLENSLFNLSSFLNIDEVFFDNLVKEYKSLYKSKFLNLNELLHLDKAIIYRIIDKWLLENYSIKISYKQLFEVLKLLEKNKNWQFKLQKGFILKKEYDLLYIESNYDKSVSYEYKLYPNDEVHIKEANLIITSTIENFSNIDKLKYAKNKVCFEYISQMEEGFIVRNRRNGDKFVPFGRSSEKKLKDIFIDLKIPKLERDKVPLVLFQDKILWIAGFCRSAFYPIKESSKKIICFTLKEVKSANN